MATKLEICNSALIKIGVEPVTAIPDGSKASILCNSQYDIIRKKLLRSHPWSFAIKREVIAADVSGGEIVQDAFGFWNLFTPPSDYLRILRIGDDTPGYEWKMEANKIMSKDAEINCVYIADIEDEGEFDTIFTEALSWMLASDLAYSMLQSSQVAQLMEARANEVLKDARSFNSFEGTPESWDANTWLDARFGLTTGWKRNF